MAIQDQRAVDASRRATSDDIRHVLGDIDDTTVAEILAVRPSYGDLSDAAIWARGDGDLIAREHRELSAGAMAVAEILVREDEEVADESN
jgi:hypothetical protein